MAAFADKTAGITPSPWAEKPAGKAPLGESAPTSTFSASSGTNGAATAQVMGHWAEPGSQALSRHASAEAPPVDWAQSEEASFSAEEIGVDDPGHTYHVLADDSVVVTSEPRLAQGPAAKKAVARKKEKERTGWVKDDTKEHSAEVEAARGGLRDETQQATVTQFHPEEIFADNWVNPAGGTTKPMMYQALRNAWRQRQAGTTHATKPTQPPLPAPITHGTDWHYLGGGALALGAVLYVLRRLRRFL